MAAVTNGEWWLTTFERVFSFGSLLPLFIWGFLPSDEEYSNSHVLATASVVQFLILFVLKITWWFGTLERELWLCHGSLAWCFFLAGLGGMKASREDKGEAEENFEMPIICSFALLPY